MSTGVKVAIAAAAFLVIAGVTLVGTFVGTNNELVALEEGIVAQYDDNKNSYDNMWKKFKEVSQVPSMYTEDLKKVYDSAIQSRYGKEGSQAMFQWLKENNPNFDASMYTKIQQVVESGRNSFKANQTALLDKKRVYQTELRQFPTNIVAGLLGFPEIDLDKYGIVTSEDTEQAFDSKQSDQVNLR